jgi:hypothetical protein
VLVLAQLAAYAVVPLGIAAALRAWQLHRRRPPRAVPSSAPTEEARMRWRFWRKEVDVHETTQGPPEPETPAEPEPAEGEGGEAEGGDEAEGEAEQDA